MNFVGKILVLLIMVASIVYAGLATFVFSTAENYKLKNEELTKKVAELNTTVTQERELKDAAEKNLTQKDKDLKKLVDDHQLALTERDERYKQLEDSSKEAEKNLQVSAQSLQQAQKEAEIRVAEANTVRDILKKLEEETNGLKIEQTKLNVTIRDLQLKLETAVNQNSRLLADNAAYANWLRSKGFDDDVSRLRGVSAPPQVEGRLLRVDVSNSRVELSLGSDDGLKPGHEMFMYRTNPPEFLGKVKIVETAPDKSSAVVVGKTYQGKRLMEGDHVATKIPRGL